ncbi:MAG TPA: (d)CMP kinase [Anaerolineae bacterium]
MSLPATIAIDGSAASGKSTVGALLARSLGYLFFDTGVMYRAVTWAALDRKIDVENTDEVSELAETIVIEVKPSDRPDDHQAIVLVDGQDVTTDIRTPAVEAKVSRVSSYPRVRTALTEQQRHIAAAGSIVMAGRDIGTVVLPEADLKIFMRASAEERASRRYNETVAQGKPANFAEILAAIRERDRQDQEKPISPMIPASDAVVVDTDQLDIEEVLAQLMELVTASKNKGT